ncbi:MAG: flagellar hook-associated protein FlgK [Phycisphaerae bacterium]|nr:flagellar hook-associated protein FlgK [Phycisphaerae bacterium]NUQ45802.1 flagellar hook-associated protein FlgK [Phycisphaerae bacterium]
MGLNTSALSIGRSALLAYQQALQLTGNNIANAANPIYSRQTANFAPLRGNVGGLQLGQGVQITSIQRHVLESLEGRLRGALSDRDAALTRRAALNRVELLLNPLGETNLGTTINELFSAFHELQNTPEDASVRGLVVRRGEALASSIQQTRRDLLLQREDLNADVVALTDRADVLASQIADLNVQIASSEAGNPGAAAGLRDQRTALLQELSSLVHVTVREQPGGSVNVYIGNEPLIEYGTSRGLKTVQEPAGSGLLNNVVRFADDNSVADVRSGQIAGAIEARDGGIDSQLSRLNTLARALIQEVNKRHASGQGLTPWTGLTGTYAVNDANAALNTTAAGLDLTPQSGTFFIDVRDVATGQTTRHQITVDLDGQGGNDTTLTSLAAQIMTTTGGAVTAAVQPDGRLSLNAAAGTSFSFADDRTDVLAALGLNTFFDGRDASDISVNALVSASPSLVAAATNGLGGDGSNAGLLAALVDAPVAMLGGVSLAQYHQGSAAESAVAANAATNALDAADVMLGSLQAQRESISGVNLDEEAVRLVMYQRSFQGAAQYLSVVDEMLQTLLSLVR